MDHHSRTLSISNASPAETRSVSRPAEIDIWNQCSIKRETLYFGDLIQLLNRQQSMFDRWEANGVFTSYISNDIFHRARLVVHEWIANLIQHAHFESRIPEIGLMICCVPNQLRCAITDNSIGFMMDLDPEVTLEKLCTTLPESGIGLYLLKECTDQVLYCDSGPNKFRLEFVIS